MINNNYIINPYEKRYQIPNSYDYKNFLLNDNSINEYLNKIKEESTPIEYKKIESFFQNTCSNNILDYTKGKNLSQLVDAVTTLQSKINDFNLDSKIILERGIVFRLGVAIGYKRIYYHETFLGRITQLFLKLIGQWNNGNTRVIEKATQAMHTALQECNLKYLELKEGEQDCSNIQKDNEKISDLRFALMQLLLWSGAHTYGSDTEHRTTRNGARHNFTWEK